MELNASLAAPLVMALACSARGALALADGDLARACSVLRDGVKRWAQMRVPCRAARGRMLLAQAYVRRDDPHSAALESSVPWRPVAPI